MHIPPNRALRTYLPALILTLLGTQVARADTAGETVTVRAGEHGLNEAPYAVEWSGETPLSEDAGLCLVSGDDHLPGQVERSGNGRTLVWFLATVPAGETREYAVTRGDDCVESRFAWRPEENGTTRLDYGETPVLEYVHPEFDPENIEETKKPFHMVYSPDGERRLTKGLGGLYPHHRGIYFGYNGIRFDGGSADIWHAANGEYSEHRETLRTWAGPVFGGHTVRIAWVDAEGTEFIEETRTLRAFKQSTGEYLIDFTSTLESRAGEIELGGDNHHAGVQFRATQFVADNSERSRFLRPGAWVDLDPETENAGITGLPWNALQFTIEGDDYTVAYLTHPANSEIAPKSTHEMSERRYGRFGEFIPATLTEDNPLTFRYRFWITARRDDIDRSEIDAQHRAFADAPL